VEHLRQEILNAQQVRSDLLKWKLVVVGALGAAGLGLAGANTAGHADLVLCAAPLASVYVDLLCRHLSLRILVIGRYLQEPEAPPEREELARYERFVERYARDLKLQGGSGAGQRPATAFDLEDWAISWSSVAVSLGVLTYGSFVIPSAVAPGAALIASGAVGFAVTLLARMSYERRERALRQGTIQRAPEPRGT
jgi:hypothetical protein